MEEIWVIIITYAKCKTSSKLINHNLGDKLSDPNIGQKLFWTAFKRIVNTKKQTNTPPIIENDGYRSDFLQKANRFNEYFATQSTINNNGSVLSAYIPKTNKFFISLSLKNKLLILFPSIMQTNLNGIIISR